MAKINVKDLLIAFDKSPDEAIKYLKSKGMEPSGNWKETFEAIKKDAFAIAGVKGLDAIMEAKSLIVQAMEGGLDLYKFKKQFAKEFDLRMWHAKLVVNQNISNSYNAGRLEMQQTDTDAFPYLQPIVQLDKKTTKICKWLAGQNVVFRADDPQLKYVYSPRHFQCRVMYIAINEAHKRRDGLKVMKCSSVPNQYRNAKEFQRLPTEGYKTDLSKYPKKLSSKFKRR